MNLIYKLKKDQEAGLLKKNERRIFLCRSKSIPKYFTRWQNIGKKYHCESYNLTQIKPSKL